MSGLSNSNELRRALLREVRHQVLLPERPCSLLLGATYSSETCLRGHFKAFQLLVHLFEADELLEDEPTEPLR